MTAVIRRLGILLVLVLTLGACAGGEGTSVSIGDRSLSRQDLTDLVVAVNGGVPLGSDQPTTLSAENYRGIATIFIRNAATTHYFASKGVSMTDEERGLLQEQTSDRVGVEGGLGFLAFESPAFNAIVDNAWVSNQPVETFFDDGPPAGLDEQLFSLRLVEIVSDSGLAVDVESRVGLWDAELGEVTPANPVSLNG
ncbi:MAG: hypothetical protein ACI81L_000133 [Verrucomicrobiales bacterium]|jgi:hypothetical protein